MNLLDDKLLAEVADDTEDPGELGEEDKDFLKCIEKMVEEVKDESGSID
jgi:hypothetical protein